MKLQEKIIYWLYNNGVLIGLPINILVLAWDIPMWVSRGFVEYSICWKGGLLLMLGTALCTFGELSEYWMEVKTGR